MYNPCQSSAKSVSAIICLVFSLLARNAGAAFTTWDPQGTTGGTIVSPTSGGYTSDMSGIWENALWSTSETGQATPQAWVEGTACVFACQANGNTPPFTVTMNSSHTVAGIFNGPLTPDPCNVTIIGTGSIILPASTTQGFETTSDTGDAGSTIIKVPITGSAVLEPEGNGQLYLSATNTYTGGTLLGQNGIVNFTNFSFGTGPITMSASGGALVVEGSAAVKVTNAFVAAAVNLNIVGNPAGVTFSGPWNLAATPAVGSGVAGNLVTISGIMSGAGGFTKYNPAALVLSGANTYSGGTTISNGVLSVTNDNNLGTAPGSAALNLTLSGGSFNASNTFTLNSKRLITLTANSAISVSSGNTLTYGGVISGSANLAKTNSGTLVLSGPNGYTGTTTISGSGTLEADSQGGSAVGTNTVLLQSPAILSGSGIVSGLVSGNGNIEPGTPSGPATLTLGNGMDLSSGGTYIWRLTSDSTTANFSTISIIGGNLKLGGTSKLSINSTAGAPSTNNPFWQTQEAWTVIPVSGSAGNTGSTKFTTLLNGTFAAGNFTNYVFGNGNIVLLFLPNFPVFDTLYDSGAGFFSGENLILTNFSGLTLNVWSSTNASLSVSNWTLVGAMQEQPLAPALPGYSRYAINVTPTVSPTYYVAGNMNTGAYIYSPVPATILTTADFSTFTVTSTNVAIATNGVLALLPAPPVILPGSTYSINGFQFQFTAATNQNYTVHASSDLSTWSSIGSGTISSSPVTFTDSAATNSAKRFYRVSLP